MAAEHNPKVTAEEEPSSPLAKMCGPGGFFDGYQASWPEAIREILLGVTIAFAQIPNSCAFAYMSHVKPPLGLHAAWILGLICAVFGGRPAMINGSTAAFGAIIGTFISDKGLGENGDGVELLFPSVILAGFLQFMLGALNLNRFILLLPASVITGFCNGLAIVIFIANLAPFKDSKTNDWRKTEEVLFMVCITLISMAVLQWFPQIPKLIPKSKVVVDLIPATLIAVVIASAFEFVVVRPSGYQTVTIRDVSEFTSETALPVPFFLDHDCCDYDMAKLSEKSAAGVIIIQGILLTLVGTFESLLTAEVVEDYVKTPTDGRRVMLAMGGGNMVCGFLGTMGGNALIGNTTLNVLMGGKLRIGPTITALTIMIITICAYPLLNYIPVAALVGLMMIVVIRTFKWFSLKMFLAAALPKSIRDKINLQMKVPRYEAFAILATTVLANVPKGTNLAYAVLAGVIISALGYSWRTGQLFEINESKEGDKDRFDVNGPLFFASANRLSKYLNPNKTDNVRLVFGKTTIIDYTALDVLNKVRAAYVDKGKDIVFEGLDQESMKVIEKAEGHFGSIKPAVSDCHPSANKERV